jgi:hypothetical protein
VAVAVPRCVTWLNGDQQATCTAVRSVVVLAVAGSLACTVKCTSETLAGRWCTYTADDRRGDEDRVLYLRGRLDKAA